ncbi:hypothetical protein [Actinoplanes regularis]|uniref:hypothetical protein n=1 Tax=Actinoplanes regularis TaxID=52697 RepID=UPI0024A03C44|nr:hypothetical protein [Actinoplanes regularis]GLW30774.1 hypothetical protein Areg01_37140 [Actinoplanes regularis]
MSMVAEMLLHEPAPVAIWGALWLATIPAVLVLASPASVHNLGRALIDACAFLIGRPADGLFAASAGDETLAYAAFGAEFPAGFPAEDEPFGNAVPDAADPISADVAAVSERVSAPMGPVAGSAPGRFFRRAAKRREERLRREIEAVRGVRYAEEVRVAADQAGYVADRWQEHWEAAGVRVDATFRAWQAADSRMRRSRAAVVFGTPATGQSPAEYADRERFLHLAVRAAAERGELPTSAVADALTGRGGWDARLHPVDQELVIQSAAAAHLEAVWKQALEAEKLAWRDAQVARRDWQRLCQEAILASAYATAVRHLLPAEPVKLAQAAHPVARVA